MRINLYNESHLKRPAVLSALPPKSHLKARKYWAREIFALLSRIYAVCLRAPHLVQIQFNVSLFVFHIPKLGGVSPWDSIGSYLEWGPSAHNGNANWATKCGKNSPRVKYVCTGKSPACQISLLYHSLFRFCCYTAGYLCFCGRLFMHCQLSRNSAKKTQIWIVPSHWVQISPYP